MGFACNVSGLVTTARDGKQGFGEAKESLPDWTGSGSSVL